jgi:Cu/Ag efflux pump CusA
VQTVTANVYCRDLTDFEREARERIGAALRLGAGEYVVFAGQGEAEARARRDLVVHALLAGAAILALLYAALGRLRNVLVMLANLPFALCGGVAAVLLGGGWLSLGAIVGFVTLFGITLRNSIMLVSHYQHLVIEERLPWNAATAIRGAQERLPSILMTALVTGLGLLPLALGTGNPGREIEGPMALVIVGGLTTSTLLNLLVLPALLLRFGDLAVRGTGAPATQRL